MWLLVRHCISFVCDRTVPLCSSILHSIESQNEGGTGNGGSASVSLVSGGSSHAVLLQGRKLVLQQQQQAATITDVETKLAQKVALLDQPVREFISKPDNPQVSYAPLHAEIFCQLFFAL